MACKGQHDRVQNEEETKPAALKSLVSMGDTTATGQLNSGFYGLENSCWRWTSGKFSVTLHTPAGAAASGGVLAFS